ncbi:MAG: GNAT family N-acetyltransferase [Candidatus Thorarchaeota archaeon]
MVIPIYNYAEIIIRRAELNEVALIKKIIKDAYAGIKKKLSRSPGALNESLDKISRQIQMGNQYVALVGDNVVGCMRVSLSGQNGVISRIAVLTKFRKRRVGTMLIEYGENLLEHSNATSIEIDVYGAIEEQKEFYEKLGYEETERTVREKEEIVIMTKSLLEPEIVEEDDY